MAALADGTNAPPPAAAEGEEGPPPVAHSDELHSSAPPPAPEGEARPAVVVDPGAYSIKAGWAGEERPRIVLRAKVGVGKTDESDLVFGQQAEERRDTHIVRYVRPYEDWDTCEQIWRHTFFNELRVNPEEQPVVLSEPLFNPKANRERLTQLMFETFNVPAMFVNSAAVLALYASGRTTGCVVDFGFSDFHVVPVYEGYALHAARSSGVTERLHDRVSHFCSLRAPQLSNSIAHRLIKEVCYVARDFDAEVS